MRHQFREEESQSTYRVPETVVRKVEPTHQRTHVERPHFQMPRKRFLLLAFLGIVGLPWYPSATANNASTRIPTTSANVLYGESVKRLMKLQEGQPTVFEPRKRLSKYTPADWKARQEYLNANVKGQHWPKGLEDASGFRTVEESRAHLKACQSELATIQKGLTLPFYAPALVGSSRSELVGVRELARLSARAGNLKQLDGDFSGALSAYLDAYALGMQLHQAKNPTLVTGMIGVLCEGIGVANAEPTVAHLTASQARAGAQRLETLMAQRKSFAQILEGEKEVTQGLYLEPLQRDELAGRVPALRLASELILQRYRGLMGQTIEKAQRPYAEVKEDLDPKLSTYDPTSGFMPNVQRALESHTWRGAFASRVLLKLALQAYQAEHAGQFPPELAELVRGGHLKTLPTDPFATTANAPFHYDPVTGKVWSVGWDGLNNGGGGDDTLTKAR